MASIIRFFVATLLAVVIVQLQSFSVAAEKRKHFFIPEELETELKVRVEYNDTHVFFLFEFRGQRSHSFIPGRSRGASSSATSTPVQRVCSRA